MPHPNGLSSNTDKEIARLRKRVLALESKLVEFGQIRQQLQEEHSFRKGVIENTAEGICACYAIEEQPFVKFTLWNPRMDEIT